MMSSGTSGGRRGLLQRFEDLEQKSKTFFGKSKRQQPTKHNFISKLKKNETKEKIFQFANRAYPVVHADVIGLAEQFLVYKRKNGTVAEKLIYEEPYEVPEFMHRLITKRPLIFMNSNDYWVDKEGNSGQGEWNRKANENMLQNFLSYDEIKISALMQLSSETILINSGNRYNEGQKGSKDSFIPEAVYIAAVGARFEKPNVMEYQDIVQNEKNTRKDEVFETYYDRIIEKKSSGMDDLERVGESLFNVARYKQRMKLSFETFLLEADQRGKEQGKETKVYCHVVGLGMGVWQLRGYPGQVKHWFSAFKESLETLLQSDQLGHISDIDFSHVDPGIKDPESPDTKVFHDGRQFPFRDQDSHIKIHVSKRDPFQTLGEEDKNKLLVAMFAWDGNSYVGNEYWEGMLTASGDPAAASCSFIPELLNPDINLNISGGNLHVACPGKGILSYDEYKRRNVSEENSTSTKNLGASKRSKTEFGEQSKENDQVPPQRPPLDKRSTAEFYFEDKQKVKVQGIQDSMVNRKHPIIDQESKTGIRHGNGNGSHLEQREANKSNQGAMGGARE